MKKLLNVATTLLTIVLMASCLNSSEDEAVYYNDTAITSFSLGTLNRKMHTTAKDGSDSIYTTTVKGSNYTFSIDQLSHTIFNPDSLPLGTDAEHVVCTITSKNSGLIVFKKTDSDSLFYYSSTDSIDFSQERELRVYSTDGEGYQKYTVKVNVHQQDGDAFAWTQMPDNNLLAELSGMKAMALGKQLFVFGQTEGTTVGYTSNDGANWTALTPNINTPLQAKAYQQTVANADSIYMLNGTTLMRTANGNEWDEIGTTSISQLIGASKRELYALDANGSFVVSYDGGHQWTEEHIDADASLLPTTAVATTCYAMNMADSTDYVIMAGNSTAKTDANVVWRKIAEYNYHSEPGQWVYMEANGNRYEMPKLDNLVMLPYDDGVLAIGTTNGNFGRVYQSRDNGITWKYNKYYQLPDNFDTSTTRYAATSDGINIWLFGGKDGQVWRGRLNRLAW